MVLIILGNGAVANELLQKTKGNNSGWIVIPAGRAFTVLSAVAISGRISGTHLNLAVTLASILKGSMVLSTGIFI